jgi:hypothetical protein
MKQSSLASRDSAKLAMKAILDGTGAESRTDTWKHPAVRKMHETCSDIKKVFYRQKTPNEKHWKAMKICADALNVDISHFRPSKHIIEESFGSFVDTFDLALMTMDAMIKEFADTYYHFAPSITEGPGFVIGECELLGETWEGKLPAYKLYREDEGGRYEFNRGYFRNDAQLFLIGSRKGRLDARLHVFDINQSTGQGLYGGIMAGVSHLHVPFASNCCLIRARGLKKIQNLGQLFKLSDLETICPDVHSYFANCTNPLIVPRGIGL